jgi:hypothetical protein
MNAHSELWEEGRPENTNGKTISEYLISEPNRILVTPKNLGTRPSNNSSVNSTIDLTIASPVLAPSMTIHTGPYWSSDHLPVIINVNLDISPPNIPNPNWKFTDEKWDEWNEIVSKSLTDNNLRDASSPEEAYPRRTIYLLDIF